MNENTPYQIATILLIIFLHINSALADIVKNKGENPMPTDAASQKTPKSVQTNFNSNHHYFTLPDELLNAVKGVIKETEVVADVGCGIVPMNYFRPKLHFLVEPWKEYSDILSHRHVGDKSIIVLRMGGLEAMKAFADNSVDSVFLLDVIEHLNKDEGKQLVQEIERVAREQIVIFTPLGFMPQHMHEGEADGWGLSGSSVQEHRSGWLPEDFSPEWEFYICEKFHAVDYKGDSLEKPFGAFFAIRNFDKKTIATPSKASDIRRPLPSELELAELQLAYQKLNSEFQALQTDNQKLNGGIFSRLHNFVKRLIMQFQK